MSRSRIRKVIRSADSSRSMSRFLACWVSKISASFHTEDRRDSPTHAGTRTARKNTNRRHMADDHRGADTKIATSSPR